MLQVIDARVKNRINPVGIGRDGIQFSWKLESDEKNVHQKTYQIYVWDETNCIVWDSGLVSTDTSTYIPYDGEQLRGKCIYHWQVEVTDNNDEAAKCERSSFETAPEGRELKGRWIETNLPAATLERKTSVIATMFPSKKISDPEEKLRPATYFRKEFNVRGTVRRARLYASAHGFYVPYLNGSKVDNRYMAPEFTAYQKRILFQTYDITKELKKGQNAFGAIVADGWWCGRISASGVSCFFGDKHGLWSQIEIWYEDGTTETIISDDSFQYGIGAYIYSDFFIGEKYVADLEPTGWNRIQFHQIWPNTHLADYKNETLCPQENEPVRIIERFVPQKIIRTPKGELVLDIGQIIHGMLTMKIHATKGTIITLQHTETLDNQGNYLHSITGRNMEHKDIYVCSGMEGETYTPTFAFHGFRYVKITGVTDIAIEDFVVNVVASDNNKILDFQTSNSDLNQLIHNIYWSQVGNFVSIPTDCPQRERGGYTGDMEVYISTASMFQDVRNFVKKWLVDLRLEQRENGSVQDRIPVDSPLQLQHDGMSSKTQGIAGWGDAAVIVPYSLYEKYGDISILKSSYDSMKKWTAYVEKQARSYQPFQVRHSYSYRKDKDYREAMKYLWNTGMHYGDWLAPSSSASENFIPIFKNMFATSEIFASGYFANTVRLMLSTAEILGENDDVKRYTKLYERIKAAFRLRYFNELGELNCNSQGAYVMVLAFDLVPKEWIDQTVEALKNHIIQNDRCLDTGFLSIGLLMDTLCRYGLKDMAYELLYQTKCPSWLYEIQHGATTIWESWNAIQDGKNPAGVSYNHYAFGCVGDWMIRMIGGLEALEPGYKRFRVYPRPDQSLSESSLKYTSIYGDICIHWRKVNEICKMELTVPCNTTAQVILADGTIQEVGSGQYVF